MLEVVGYFKCIEIIFLVLEIVVKGWFDVVNIFFLLNCWGEVVNEFFVFRRDFSGYDLVKVISEKLVYVYVEFD